MRKNRRISYVVSFISMVLALIICGQVISAQSMAPESIDASSIATLEDGVIYNVDSNGNAIYSLNGKVSASGTLNKVGEVDAAIKYIINSNVSASNDQERYLIKQYAIWLYQDEVKGTSNLDSNFYSKEKTGIVKAIYDLKDSAKANNSYKSLNISVNYDDVVESHDGYYTTTLISVNSTNSDNYNVVMVGAPDGSIVVGEDGTEKNTFAPDEKFMIKIPINSVQFGTTIFNVRVQVTNIVKKAYEYSNGSMRFVSVYDDLSLATATAKVTVIKSNTIYVSDVDAITGVELSGADLSLYDANGNLVRNWITVGTHYALRDLTDGVYTLIQNKAPDGYRLNETKLVFEVKNSNVSEPVIMPNYPDSSGVLINVQDISNKMQLAGAILSIRTLDGKEVYSFTSTEKVSYIELKPGRYILVETQAPTGYVINSAKVEFEVKNDGAVHEATIYNARAIEVPNTSANMPVVVYIIGFMLIISGVYVMTRKANN